MPVSLKFGTDGVRGLANAELTPELALGFGRAAARVLGTGTAFAVGRDTRRSGPLLESAFVAGLAAEGIDALLLGVVPTPAVAWACAEAGIPGAVISASHNPFPDNGIKLFAAGGRKLSDEIETAIEAELTVPAAEPPSGAAVGVPLASPATADRWLDAMAATIEGRRLDGLRIVIDTANGAASSVAGRLFTGLGADVSVIHDAPDGTNINERCGATDTASLRATVSALEADLGLALDGDADRCLAVDASGTDVDGDQILAVLALDRRERGALPDDTVVVTVMSNLGFRRAMADHGITVVDTPVGDRYVLDALDDRGLALGGEQSGHVIQRDLVTTGDGLLTAVHLADVIVRTGRPLAELAGVMVRLPQVLRNVRLPRPDAAVLDAVAVDVAAVEAQLGEQGRVLLRPSGTEPVVRVMVEAPTQAEAEAAADRLVRAVTDAVA
jgi:phosphoglucosamine mutase